VALKIKPAPRQLEPGDLIEEVWPGDDSVDLERSDLVTWCIEGGKAGLAFKDDGYQVWKLRPLRGRALSHVLAVAGIDSDTEAFRLALVDAPGVRIRWQTLPAGLRGITDATIDMIEDSLIETGVFEMQLPVLAAADAHAGVERDKVRQDLVGASFFSMLASHVLAVSFRGRR
jgi:hypothetical protein